MARADSSSHCPGPIDRRSWLKIGGLSLGALVTGLEPNLARLFAAEQAAQPPAFAQQGFLRDPVLGQWRAEPPRHSSTSSRTRPRRSAVPFRPIRTKVPGLHITDLLPTLAEAGRQVRPGPQPAPQPCRAFRRHAPLPDRLFLDCGQPQQRRVSGHRLGCRQAAGGPGRRGARLYVGNTKFYGGGPGYLGPAYAPFMPSPNPLSSTGNNTYDPVPALPDPENQQNLALSPEGTLTLRRRAGLLRDARRRCRACSIGPRTWRPSTTFRSARWNCWPAGAPVRRLTCPARRPGHASRYGDTHWGKSLLTARRLVEAGVRFVQCQAGFRLRPETGRHQQLGRPFGQLATSSRPTRRSCRPSIRPCRP